MKKIALILLNIIIIFILLLEADLFVFINKSKKIPIKPSPMWYDAYTILPIEFFTNKYKNYLSGRDNSQFRQDLLKSDDRSVLFLGCSTVWGTFIQNVRQTFPGVFSELTGRTVFNRALPGIGLAETIAMFQMGFDNKVKNPEYVCYVYIGDHIKRLYEPCFFFRNEFVLYKYKNNNLVEKSDLDVWYWHSYLLRSLYDTIVMKKPYQDKLKFLSDHFLLLNQEIKKKFPNSKFIIFAFESEDNIRQIENNLTSNNIQIVYLSELSDIDFTQKQYKQNDGQHPNEYAWATITPLFINKLSL